MSSYSASLEELISNEAFYPYSCFEIKVFDSSKNILFQDRGLVESVSVEGCKGGLEQLRPRFIHGGGYKGLMVMNLPSVQLPCSSSFKIIYTKFHGNCHSFSSRGEEKGRQTQSFQF
jgi:hypothetical protein